MSIGQKADSNTPSNIEKNLADEKLKDFETASDKYEEISEDAYKQNSSKASLELPSTSAVL